MGAMHALGRLTQLQHLVIDTVSSTSNASLRPLSGLSDLRSCVLTTPYGAPPPKWDIAALFALSRLMRLTRLQLDCCLDDFDPPIHRFDDSVLVHRL